MANYIEFCINYAERIIWTSFDLRGVFGDDLGGEQSRLSRRTVLKSVGGLGAGAAIGGFDPELTTADEPGDGEVSLPADVVKEYWYSEDGLNTIPLFATRGIQQTNVAVVDDADVYIDDCGDVPGIRHRFTVLGLYQGIGDAEVQVNVDGADCGRLSLTPNYTWSGYLEEWLLKPPFEEDDEGGVPSSETELRSVAREHREDVFEPSDPVDDDAAFAMANLALGGASLLAGGGLPFALAGVGLSVLEVMELFADDGNVDVHERDETSIHERLGDEPGMQSRIVWSDFSIVVPAGEATSFTVDWNVSEEANCLTGHDTGCSESPGLPDLDDMSHEVEIPAIDIGEEPGAATPTITRSGGPIETSVDADGAVTLEGGLSDHSFIGTPQWHIETATAGYDDPTGETVDLEYEDDGVYAASYRVDADRESVYQESRTFRYMAAAPVQVGEDPFTPNGEPSVMVEGPSSKRPDRVARFTAETSTPNGGVDEYEWTIYTSVQGQGQVEYATQGPSDDDSYTDTFPCGSYTVEVVVTDQVEKTATASREFVVRGPPPEPEIVAPDQVVPGESFTLSYEVANGVTAAGENWRQDAPPGGASQEVTFEETGEKTLGLYVTTACNNSGRTERTIEVTECSPFVSLVGPDEVDPGNRVTVTPNVECEPDGYVWSIQKSVEEQGLVEVETDSGDGHPGTYSFSEDCGSYTVILEVDWPDGTTKTAEHQVVVSGPQPEPTIQAPDTVAVGESFTLSYDVANGVTAAGENWRQDAPPGGASQEVTFDEPGEKDLGVYVTTACDNSGSASTTVEVVDPTLEVSLDDSYGSVDEGEHVTYDASVTSSAGIDEYEWRVQFQAACTTGWGDYERASGFNSVGSFSFTADSAGNFAVELVVTDETGKQTTAGDDFTAGSWGRCR